MFITGKLLKKSQYKAFVYPYILVMGFLGLLWIVNISNETQLKIIHSVSSIHQYQARNAQQQFRTILEAKLQDKSLSSLQYWINDHPFIYYDLNSDGLTDSLFLVDNLGINGQIADLMVCHYLLKTSEWGISSHPITTIPLETNLNKSIHVLPNRYCVAPKIGLLYQVDALSGIIVSCKKISLQHSIE